MSEAKNFAQKLEGMEETVQELTRRCTERLNLIGKGESDDVECVVGRESQQPAESPEETEVSESEKYDTARSSNGPLNLGQGPNIGVGEGSRTLEQVIKACAGRNLPLDTFSGKQNWEEYVKRFENLATYYSWSISEMGLRLAASLTGDALLVQDHLTKEQRFSYRALCNALEQTFSRQQSCQKSRTMLHTARLEEGEKLVDLGSRLRQLVKQGYPQLPNQTREELLVDAFIRCIPDEITRVAVGSKRASTLREALDAAMEIAAYKECGERVRPRYESRSSPFPCIERAGLRLKAKKCKLLQEETVYLGHVISRDGVSCDPKKLSVVKEWPVPTNVKETRAFLGFVSYYRRCKLNRNGCGSVSSARWGRTRDFICQ
ncbi:uncharacterized protein LOC144750143 isoform X1 [Ciona intestinalis]